MKNIRQYGEETEKPKINWGMVITQMVIASMIGFFLRGLLEDTKRR